MSVQAATHAGRWGSLIKFRGPDSLQTSPSQGAFVFLLLSFTPLVLAFHSTVWATALAPTSVISFSRPVSPVGISRHPRVATWFFAAAGIVAPLSVIPSIVLLARARASEIVLVESLLIHLRVAQPDAELLRTLFGSVVRGEARVLLYYRAYTGTWCVWIVMWLLVSLYPLAPCPCACIFKAFPANPALCDSALSTALLTHGSQIYVPTALRLAKSLRSRQRRFQRSSNSLRVLEEMTSHDGERWSGSATPELSHLKTAPLSCVPRNGSLPRLDQRHSLILQLSPHSDFEIGSPSTSRGKSSPTLSKERNGTEIIKGQEIRPKSRVQTQVEELAASLAKTRRILWSVAIQFVFTITMGLTL